MLNNVRIENDDCQKYYNKPTGGCSHVKHRTANAPPKMNVRQKVS